MDATPSPTDRGAFEALVLRHQTAICAVAYSVLRDRARSEEVAQDALLIAWRDRTTITVTPGWICGIARNLARNASRRVREVTMDREPATDAHDARDALIAHEDSARANAALAKLPDKYRDAIAIYYRSDESYAEVASALGITEASARQRVHRARERLNERRSIVESALRATRPGPAFTAAVIAAWALGRSGTANAATAGASKPAWLVPMIGIGAIASTAAIAVAIRSASADQTTSHAATASTSITATRDTRAPNSATVARRFPLRVGASATTPPALPRGFTAASTPTTSLPQMTQKLDLDFKQAPVDDLLQLLAHTTATPIWSTLEPTKIDIRVKETPVLDVLDEVLTQAHATRTEVEAIRIVERGPSDAATLGGDTMSLSVKAIPLNQVLALIEPRLETPIARVGNPFRVINEDGSVIEDQSPKVTLELTNVSAGLVLQRALEQTGYGYELTTGFVITPD